MASSFSVDTETLHLWRDRLRSIDFWLDGYLKSPAYRDLEQKLDRFRLVMWNVGVGPTACFTRAISSITRDVKIKRHGPYDHVIEVDMKRAAAQLAGTELSINDKLHFKVAEQLGLLDQEQEQEYDRLLEEDDELRYYTYGLSSLQHKLSRTLHKLSTSFEVPQIIQKLVMKKYLLVVENLDEPIKPINLTASTEGLCFPAPGWKDSFWCVSTTTQDVYSRADYSCLIESFSGDDMVILTLYSLHQAAKYILAAVAHKDEQYWHHVVVRCFHYATMLLSPHCSSPHGDGGQKRSAALADITSDELIRQWSAQCILVIDTERTGETTGSSYDGKYSDIYQVGNLILEAFREYSLLEIPFSPVTTEAEEATKSAAHFLACHNLIAEHHTTDELCDGDHPRLEHMQWISHVGDQGWHLSREWLSYGASGPTTLILRHCSQQSRLLMKLESDHFFAKLNCLRALDLSYTPLKSLPPSICYLQELQYLSLRGCFNLTSPFSFPNTEITLNEINSSKNLNLLCFDLSYSNINTFHNDFFCSMPNLQELLLVKCSNLEELPPSVGALSSLTKLELTGTQIKSFPMEIFEEMKNLRSLKLIENKNLLLRRLSLRGCRKLEFVDIKEVGALEELDLSATAIKELPDSIPNLPELRKLFLLGVPSLRRFPWHKLQRLPDVFCLDQCSNRTINHSDHPQGAQVCISDSRLFYSFGYDTMNSVRAGELLTTFYVRVTSCKSTSSKLKDEEDMVMINKVQMAPPAYADINRLYLTDGVSMVSMDDVPPFRVTKRHVEISAADRYPRGLAYLLTVTKSISMLGDTHVSCLSDLGDRSFDELEECMLRRCHRMVQVFSHNRDVLSLQNAHVSRLRSLTHFYRGGGGDNFNALKHLFLEYCPRLEGIVPRYFCELPSLETLDILCCYNLKAIFYDDGPHSSPAGYTLPCLRRIRLQELPLLEHLHVDNPMLIAPAWEELHVRGCWSLRHLPRFHQQPDKAVEVSGELAWWNKLCWDGTHSHHGSYKPMLPPAFASRRERVVIESYLR
ncbi:uncharacterized protein [Miscanthus floridulus]|uniref:uncharacterized protein isoform X1 n=1 Tax=Miscanthus floridulus TaxID=154761 RepID=UPI00345ADA5A